MPGNEVADKVHNFFEQDTLSQGQNNSQVGRANWPLLSSNQWVGNQRQIRTPPNSNTRDYNILQSDSERGYSKQPQSPVSANDARLSARPEFTRGQFRNEELSLNGFMHGHQGFQARQNPLEFQGEDVVSNQLKVAQKGLPILERQQGNAPDQSPSVGRTSERLETAEAPINFDFLGRQQQLMRSQQSGMPQSQPRQIPGVSDTQLWHQQQIFRQLQELQKQRQVELQLLREGRHPSQISQLPSMGKLGTNDRLPAASNGTPQDASNCMWLNENMGGESKVASNSQMFMGGNMGWAQRGGSTSGQGIRNGLLLSNEQSQMLRSMGLVPQQQDQSLYGAPIASSRGAFNQYSHVQGISQDSAELLNRASGSQLEKPLMQSSSLNKSFQGGQSALQPDQPNMQDGASFSKQGFQGRNFFGQQENYQQVPSLPRNALMQDFQGGQQQAGWSGNLQEKAMSQMGSSQGFVSLDPGEEKILFSSDDNMWDASGVSSGVVGAGGYGNPLESTEHLNLFPSIQSGTWSALMQSAVAEASSSDTGLQDEWSGLSFQKTENQTTMLSDSAKQQADWNNTSLHNASSSTSRPFPLFDDAKMSQSVQNASEFQHSGSKSSYEQSERVQHNASYESMQQPSKESGKWLDHSPQQKSLVEGNHLVQPPMHLENVSQTAWSRRMYEQSESAGHATNLTPSAQNMPGPWVHRHGMSSYNVDSQNCSKPAGWNNNESPSPSGDPTLKISESENNLQRSQRNDRKMGMHLDRDYDGGMWKNDYNHVANSFSHLTGGTGSLHINREDSRTDNFIVQSSSTTTKAIQETSQQVLNSNNLDYGKPMVDSSMKSKADEGVARYQHQLGSQVLESSTYNSERGKDNTYDMDKDNCSRKEFSSDSYNSNQSQPTAIGGLSKDSRSLPSGNPKSMGQVGRKVSMPRRFHYHPMGNLEVDVETTNALKRVTHPQALPQQAPQGSKGNEQEYFGHPKFVGNVPDNAIDMEKEHLPGFQGNVKGSDSFVGSAGFSSQGNRTVQTCQNMLELLHKVDRSREHTTPSHLGSSDHNPSSNVPEADSSNSSVSHQWHNQSASSQGFGLRLAPPSQRMAVTNHAFRSQNSTQTINDLNSEQADSREGEKSQMWLSPSSSVQSVPPEVSQREHWDNNSSISRQMGNEASHSNMQSNSATFMSALPCSKNQLQSALISGGSGQVMRNQSVNSSNDRLASHFRQSRDIHNGVVTDQSTQASMPRAASRTPPFNLSSPEDTSQKTTTSMPSVRVSGQQFPVLESVPVSQSTAMVGRPQQGANSTMFNNVWTNVSLPGGPSHRVPPNLFHSSIPSNNNLERTSLAAQKVDRQDTRQGGNESEFGTCSTNSQRFTYAEEQPVKEGSWQQMPTEKIETPQKIGASLGQESAMKQLHGTNSISSGSLVAHPHPQDVDGGRYGKDPVQLSQRDHLSTQNRATSTAYWQNLKKSFEQTQNYALLNQVKFIKSMEAAMKSMEADPNKRGGKRLKVADSDLDAQQVASKSGQQTFDGSDMIVRDSMGSELNAAVRRPSYSSGDGKMLSFSSEGREEQNPNVSSQIVRGDVPSNDRVVFGQGDSHSRSIHHTMTSARSEETQISPQMAPSWFEQYGTFKAGRMLPVYDARNAVKPASQQLLFGKPSENLDSHASTEQVNFVKASQVGSVGQSPMASLVANEQVSLPQSLTSQVTDRNLAVVRTKKRKTEISVLLPWHKEITHGSRRLENISMAEVNWAQAANRLVEKVAHDVEDEAEFLEDGQPLIRPRRRLIITTQLMQQLLRPVPAAILSAEASLYHESVIYFIAKLALGEACGLISFSRTDSDLPTADGNKESGKQKNSQRVGDQYFSKVVEDFIGRAKKLESDLLRLDRRASLLDVRVECQDLDKFSIINRFAKFHGRGSQADGAETSSSSDAVANNHRTLPQRYVTAVAMPRNLPEGVQCLSL